MVSPLLGGESSGLERERSYGTRGEVGEKLARER